MRRGFVRAIVLALLVAACTPDRPPPPNRTFAGLPVTGDIEGARRAGFVHCFDMDAVNVRCRRDRVTIFGAGPYQAALDLRGGYGQSGFRYLTIWSDDDQSALYTVLIKLAERGWKYCYTGTDWAGDQAVFTHPSRPFSIYMDISYYGKRRIRVFPSGTEPPLSGTCTPDESLGRFGLDIVH